MKFTLSWLKEHLETDADAATIADTLTNIGLEVESVEDKAAALKDFIVGYVVSAEKHPNADKLKLCMVDTGSETVQVVCGAPNAHTGMKGVFAQPGTLIPASNEVLKIGTIRGVESRGMLCSERELLLSDEHTGIIELPADAKIGASAAAALGLNDPVIDVSITPNRGDCTSVYGIARDLAAAGIGRLKIGSVAPVAGKFLSPKKIHLNFTPETASACPIFAGRLIRNVKNGPSPKWLQDRLRAIGLRPISALVDVTNLISVDRGRPLHVFDADKLSGDMQARLAKDGEADPRARRQELHARFFHVRDRRRQSRARHCGRHGRRGYGLHRNHHECVRGIGLFRSGAASPPRAASSESFRMRATASSAASIPNSWCRGWSLPPNSFWNSAAASRRKSWSAEKPRNGSARLRSRRMR